MTTITVPPGDADAPTTANQPIRLSATRLKTYLTCPRQFRYRYVVKLPTVLTGALAFGKTIHQVLHDIHQWSIYSSEPLNEQIALSTFARLWEQVVDEQQPVFKCDEDIAEYLRLAELMLVGYVEAFREKAPPFLLEFPFEVALYDQRSRQEYILSGVIDRIEQEENGLVIVDFKTGKRKPSLRDLAGDVQLSVYAFAASEVFGQEVKELILYHMRDQTIHTTNRKPEQVRQLTDFLMPKVVRGIAERKFAPRTGFYCNFCEFRDRCRLEGPNKGPRYS